MYLISVIVTTYNWPEALALCLDSLFAQSDSNFEIIIADDGSSLENMERARHHCASSPVPFYYIHHADQGFRAGTIRNKAVAASRGDYLLFVDGDCLMRPDFVSQHRKLAARGFFVPGNRVLLNQALTGQVLAQQIPVYLKPWYYFLLLRLQGEINQLAALVQLPLGKLRQVQSRKWQNAMTCNLALWKNDFLSVNGFDELFEGWGYEDSDLVIRLIHAGIKRKEGRFAAPVLHLWHPQNDKSRQDINYQRLMERLARQEFTVAEKGVSQYLTHPVQPS